MISPEDTKMETTITDPLKTSLTGRGERFGAISSSTEELYSTAGRKTLDIRHVLMALEFAEAIELVKCPWPVGVLLRLE